ncbi:31981_t:CDS:2 [Gigaspora margarita]|uniref:BTB/POZ protein n=2 Tax=Gigaspora margarita TaxID=4874 RepID=A0A8H3X0X7_GIGMA|nr:BTB/POZ protein [Gigaspora margarita]CAG8804539.1 31981_t:CDS:2 [Gigaspora margarita]
MSDTTSTAASRERIILNVGGVRYETYRSTLIAYPTTLLGAMFADRNKELLCPVNGEHFIDRDGQLFRYILQFYRTGKMFWNDAHLTSTLSNDITSTIPISREELFSEIDYFQLPIPLPISQSEPPLLSQQAQKAAASKLDEFIQSFQRSIFEAMQYFETTIPFTFHRIVRENQEHYWNEHEKVAPFVKYLRPFAPCVGYELLDRFGTEIGKRLKLKFGDDLDWKLEKHASHVDKKVDYYRLAINIPDEFYDNSKILQYSAY